MHNFIALNEINFKIEQQNDVTIDNDMFFEHSIVFEIKLFFSIFKTINKMILLMINMKKKIFLIQIQTKLYNSFIAFLI